MRNYAKKVLTFSPNILFSTYMHNSYFKGGITLFCFVNDHFQQKKTFYVYLKTV